MSPELNTRHVPCDVFASVPKEKNNNLRDILYLESEHAIASFRSRQIILFPYKLRQKNDKDGNGVPIKSVSSYKIEDGGEGKNNIIVHLDNATACNIQTEDFQKLMALFGQPMDGRTGVCNFDDLLNIKSKMSDSKELCELVHELNFPKELINETLRHEVNMRNLGSFIMMCTPIYFGAPEGQTRLEAVSRPCFGYPLYGTAPLLDVKSKFLVDFNQEDFFKTSQSLPNFSTAFKSVQGSVLYTSAPVFDNTQLQDLVNISKMVQESGSMEINTTYQTFYQLLITEVTARFTTSMKPLDEVAFAMFDVTYESAKQRKDRLFLIDELRITNLYGILNKVLIDKMFSSRPFNTNLPQDPENKTLKCTKEIFVELTENDINWFIQKPFYSVFQCVIAINCGFNEKKKIKEKMGVVDEDYFLPTGLNTMLFTHPKVDKIFKLCRWATDPSPWVLFEMMFTVFGLDSLLDTFKQYLLKFEATSRFYDPVWLSAYVFLPITTIHDFYSKYYLKHIFDYKITKDMQGKYAPVVKKFMTTIRAVLLQEYLQTIIKFAGQNRFNEHDNFINFTLVQLNNFKDWTTSKPERVILVANEYLEMILLTLPEKLYEAILVDETFEPFQGCDFQNLTGILLKRPSETSKRTKDNMKSFEDLRALPSIADVLPVDITPSLLMEDVTLAKAYTTACLAKKNQARTPKKKKRSKTSQESPSKRTKVGNETVTGTQLDAISEKANEKAKESDEDYIQPRSNEKAPPPRELTHPPAAIAPEKDPETQQIILESQSVLLQLRLIQHEFQELNKLLQAKKLTKPLKDRLGLFGKLLKTVDIKENIFEPDTIFPNPDLISDQQHERFQSFYETFLKLHAEDAEVDKDTHKFLIYIHRNDTSDLEERFEDFDFKGNSSNDITEYVPQIKETREKKKAAQNKGKDSSEEEEEEEEEEEGDEQKFGSD